MAIRFHCDKCGKVCKRADAFSTSVWRQGTWHRDIDLCDGCIPPEMKEMLKEYGRDN